MNNVILVGRLTKDPTVNHGNSTVARYTLAVDRRFKQDGQPTADFIPCVCFGKSAEFVEKYLKKGTKMIVSGRIQTGSYTDKKNGQRVYTTDVIVETQEFAESRASSQNNGTMTPQPAMANSASADGFITIPEDAGESLPFI